MGRMAVPAATLLLERLVGDFHAGHLVGKFAVAIDTSRKKEVAKSAATISTMTLQRSVRVARLKKIHHTTIASAQKSSKNTPNTIASGIKTGIRYLKNHTCF